jgi:hypothetical protein
VGKLSAVTDGDFPYAFNIRLFGTVGTIQNNRVYSSQHYPGALDYWEFPTIKPDSGDVVHHPFASEMAHFLDCLATDTRSHASIDDAFQSMAVVFAIEESLSAGGEPIRVKDVVK